MILPLAVFTGLEDAAPWVALRRLDRALRGGATAGADGAAAAEAYVALARALLEGDWPDLGHALASIVLETPSALTKARAGGVPEGLRAAAQADLAQLCAAARRPWRDACRDALASGRNEVPALPPLEALAEPGPDDGWHRSVAGLAEALVRGTPASALAQLERCARERGVGPAARHRALRWNGRTIEGVADPAGADADALVGLDDQLTRLFANTEAFLRGAPAHNTLLYGPRGSGKSTAVRSLLPRYGERGLRLVELSADALDDLPLVLAGVRDAPQAFVLYVDDLSFEGGDTRYHPLKTLLEGGLTRRPANVVVYATSNRRHLLRERFGDRPGVGEGEDVHAWDTLNERLALADRFGLTLTFPSATQRRYLAIVEALAEREGLRRDDLAERAVRFADWGNGYSGRTARQFVDNLLQETADREP